MSDTPDFDNMSPEEMMRWMESLAKRQGASEGLTTDADMEVAEVDESDERLSDAGEYIPYGWTEERWREQQAKEAAEKEARAAQQQQAAPQAAQPPPTPDPEPEPVADASEPAAASAEGTPDFDNMSPEEMMLWMESLAKRQGASEGLTTDANMEVAEVDASDERLADAGEYIPYGWTEERWREQQAKEAAEKAARAAQQPAAPDPIAEENDEDLAAALAGNVLDAPDLDDIFSGNNQIIDDEDDIEYVDDDDDIYYETDDEDYIDYSEEEDAYIEVEEEPVAEAAADGEMPDFDSMSPDEMMRWMESLAKRQGASEGLTTDADMDIEEVDASDERLADAGEYIPYGWTEERWREQQAKEAAEREARANQQSAPEPTPEPPAQPEPVAEAPSNEDVLKAPSFDDIFGATDNELPQLDDLEDEMETVAATDGDPMSWLAGLSAAEEDSQDVPDIDMGALESLSALGGDDAGDNDDPMSWLAGLAADPESETTQAEPLQSFELTGDEDADGEGSLKWLESLAKRQGADEEELVTDADMDLPFPEGNLEQTGPGYAPYSFEEGTGTVQEDAEEPVANFDFDAEADPAAWLDSLASGVSGNAGAGEEYDSDDELVAQADTEDEEEFDSVASDVMGRLNSGGEVSPEDIDAFFRKSFEKASTYEGPDYEFADEEDDESLIAAEIPDWLQDQMASATSEMAQVEEEPIGSGKTDTSEMMIAELGLDDLEDDNVEIPDWLNTGETNVIEDEVEEPIEAEIPDWLQGDLSEDTGIIEDDIFEDVQLDDIPSLDEAQIDTSDTWVAAFMEEDTGEMERWYETQRARVDAGEIDDIAATDELESVELPIERELAEGQPMAVPDWVGAPATSAGEFEPAPAFNLEDSQEIEALADEEDMSWITGEMEEAEIDMPAWLQDTVDDSVVEDAEALPDWLASDELADVDVEDIPDWLRETMDDDEAGLPALAEPDFSFMDEMAEEEAAATPPAPQPVRAITPTRQSPAPVVPAAANIDVAATLASAATRLSDGDLDSALQDYEAVIRANTALDQVENDMRKLVGEQAYKRNAAVHRVLGDTLMRQGKLQEALDIYRKALNML